MFLVFLLLFVISECIMLKKECPHDEVHRSCAFHEEHICWTSPSKLKRVRSSPKRLLHCRSGCYCKRGYVREFLEGDCIQAINCRNRKLREVLARVPTASLMLRSWDNL